MADEIMSDYTEPPGGDLPVICPGCGADVNWKPCGCCLTCLEIGSGFGPTHNGSKYCESGSIASGGDRAHCTCPFCF